MAAPKNLGMLLLAIYLIVIGSAILIPGLALNSVAAVLALAAGILILIGK